jgi:hypothetical protein
VLGSPWVGAKALATASPAFVFAALVGAAVVAGGRLAGGIPVRGSGRRFEAILIAAAVAGGVLWSNALAYHEVSLAPHDQLAELEHIGARIAGQGPTLMTEYQPYGVRHFLRAADPEGASELRRRPAQLRNGQTLAKGASADVNQFALSALLTYRTLVLRRSPLASRPPAPFTRTFEGRYYDVWQRPATRSPSIIGDLTYGAGEGGVPDCAAVTRLAATAHVAALAAAPADPQPASVSLATLAGSPWPRNGTDPAQAILARAGSVSVTFAVPRAGRYAVWAGGTGPRAELSAAIDGARSGSTREQLQDSGGLVELGTRQLSAGSHTLRLSYGGSDWRPGSGGPPPIAGPVLIAAADPPTALLRVAPSAARQLCGQRLYWVAALSG